MAILQESTIYRRRETLSKIIDGLGLEDAYGATIERIKAQSGDKSRLGMETLMWISHAERPLRADELCHALAVQLGSTDFDIDNVPSMQTLMNCCQGLVTVDKEASTVRLVHYTLQEYLSAHLGVFSRPHSAMAEICLTYLNSQQVKAIWIYDFDYLSEFADSNPFLEYCSLYWGVHAKRDLSSHAKSLALELLQEYDDHISAVFIADSIDDLDLGGYDTANRLNGLHCASFFGIVEVVAALIEMQGYGTSTNEGYFFGNSPLAWAARNGHEEVAKMLLGRDEVDPDEPNDYGQTPLSFAAGYGHEGVVKILLGRGEVNPDRADDNGRTPLSYAVRHGHEGVVKILLRREEVNPEMIDNHNRTLLSHAAERGQEKIVKILLGCEEVNPDKPDDYGRAPLSYAAMGGYGVGTAESTRVVETLLGLEEVNPDKPDNYGQTPLSHAAWAGHEGVVSILLGREEVSPNSRDNEGRTPLSQAAENGKEGVVKILLAREEVDPERPDHHGRTPLSHAIQMGHSFGSAEYMRVVKMLLGREEVNPERPDHYGRTPLWYAMSPEYEEAVKLLLGREEVSPGKPLGEDTRGV